jgi:pimeloyl-ACP methyl ester carboxylesterase
VTPEALAVLTDMEADPVERLKRGILISCAPGFGQSHPDLVEQWLDYRIRNPILPEPYQAQMAIGLSLMAEDACFEPKLKTVQVPTLILFGEHDKVVPPGNANLLACEIPNSTVQILPNAGHFFPMEVPDEATAVIAEFLER